MLSAVQALFHTSTVALVVAYGVQACSALLCTLNVLERYRTYRTLHCVLCEACVFMKRDTSWLFEKVMKFLYSFHVRVHIL